MKDLLDILPDMPVTNKCVCLEKLPLAYAYVPYQVFGKTYSPDTALASGTVFPELNKPYETYGKEFKSWRGTDKYEM